jgi:hypothetical protein
MSTFQRLAATLCVVLFAAVLSGGQSGSTIDNPGSDDTLSCSPAPCVLPPTQVSSPPHGATDAPIAADPANPGRVILGSDGDACGSQGVLAFYVASDPGSWSTVCMVPLTSGGQEYVPDFDPVLAYDRDGVAYIGGFYLDDNGRSSFGFEGFEKSSDGAIWSSPQPAVILSNYDPSYCWMTADDNASSPYVNSVYVSCVMVGPLNNNSNNQVTVTHSKDGGATWQLVNVAATQKSPDVDLNTAMAIGKDGRVYLTWMYCNVGPQACNNNKGYMVFAKSSDGGNTWSQPKLAAAVTLIYPVPNTSIGVPDTPAIAVDNSGGPYSGNLYVVMYNWKGTFMQVQVARSTDDGTTWSKPVPVAPGLTHDQFLPWISVSPTGLVGVSWLDRRNDPNNIDYQAFAAISADGGLSFQPNVQLTTGFSNPNAVMGASIGNYTGNTWDGPDYFVAAWMDNSQTMYLQDYVGGIRLK